MTAKKINYISFHKIINFIRLGFSYLISIKRVSGLKNAKPAFISVEPANFCQLHCPECPVGQLAIKKENATTLDIELYTKLIDELRETLIHVIFYFQGEPFLHKNLSKLIKYAHDSKIYTSTSTNAQLISQENAKQIVESGLDRLIISIDGTTQEIYEKYRVGGSLEKAIKSIDYLTQWKKKLNSRTPLIEIQFLVLKTNEHQMKEMKELSDSVGADKLSFKSAQLYGFENGHQLLTTIKKHSRYEKREDGKYYIKNKQKNRCWRLWSGAVVNVGGDVLPCCFDKNSDFSFGNINEKSFIDCWQSKEASGFRENILQDRKQFNICRNCTS